MEKPFVKLHQIIDEFHLNLFYAPAGCLESHVTSMDVYRPGLQLVGFQGMGPVTVEVTPAMASGVAVLRFALPGALGRGFDVLWLALMACLALIPRARPDEMSAAAFARAAKYSGRLLFAAMWALLVMLSPFMDGWFEGFTRSRWNLMAFVSGALLAAYLCRVLVFMYFDRRGSSDD